MKRLFLIIALLYSLCTATAQNNSSYQTHPDGRITLRLRAPEGHNARAYATFIPGGWTDMSYNSTIKAYEYTTPSPVAPDFHNYKFSIDGVEFTDPQSVHTVNNCTWLSNLAIVKGDGNDIGTYISVNDVPHGAVTAVWYYSDSEKKYRRMNVYTPAEYYTNTKKRFPVLYLLHGMSNDEDAWVKLGRAPQILDNLIARGEAEPMIVVIPNGVIDIDASAGNGTEGLIQPSAEFPRLYSGEYELAFPEIVKFIDKNFRTKANKKNRAIAGLSMGGYHTANITRQYPDMFNYIGLFSAATHHSVAPGHSLARHLADSRRNNEIFQNVDEKLKTQFSKKPALYWIAIGNSDFLYNDNVSYRAQLDALSLPYTYHESKGGHSWNNWRDYLRMFAPMLFK